MLRHLATVLMLLCLSSLWQKGMAQPTMVHVRGVALDNKTKAPLFGAAVSLEDADGQLSGTTAGTDGLFSLEKVPAGSYTVTASFVGFDKLVLTDVFISAESNAFITLELEPSSTDLDEVLVSESRNNGDNTPINNMAVLSARSFTVQQSEMVAASLGDPSRLALSFAGVRGQSDILNGIVVRGNAPKGVMWRIEGVEVPSPNHFSQEGYGAGAVCMVSSRATATSDFYSGAFPAEYGNAMSAVFDVRMKKGDDQKRHYFMQLGMMGVEAGMEGPFTNNKKASYLINYRYSTLAILEKIGLDIGNTITSYQDLAVKLNFPSKRAGTFSVFGVGGKSAIDITEENNRGTRREEKLKTYEMGFYGISNVYSINANHVLKTTALFAANRERLDKDEYFYRTNIRDPDYRQFGSNMYFRNVVQLDSRMSGRSSLRSGIITSNMRFKLDDVYDINGPWQGEYEATGITYTLQAYSQWKYALTEKWTMHTGMHLFFFGLNNKVSAEPRTALSWQISRKHVLGFAAGLHSKLESLANYMVYDPWQGGRPNEDLGFTKAAHTGISYEITPRQHLKLKTELYFQYLYQVPISTDESSSYSMLNSQDRYTTQELVNKGRGMNYGVEMTIEKSFAKNYYILANGSLFEAKYYAADGVWRNSRYNSNFITSLTAGKDFVFGKGNKPWTFGLNARALWSGGERTWESEYEEHISNYFRVDSRVSISRQRQNIKWTWALDIQNTTNRINESTLEDEIRSAGVLPVMSFRVDL